MSHSKKPSDPRALMAWSEYHIRNSGKKTPPKKEFDPQGREILDRNGDGIIDSEDLAWHLAMYPPPETDTGGTGSVSYPPRTVAEDLEYLRAKLPIDVKFLEEEYKLRGLYDVEIEGVRFKNAKELQDMSQKDRLAYLRLNLKLTAKQEVAMMVKSHANAIELTELKAEIDRVMQSDQNEWQEAENDLGRELDRELQGLSIEARAAISEAQIASSEAIAAMQIGSSEAIAAAGIASQEGMQVKSFTHAEKMQAGKQAFDKVMQAKGFEDDKFLQARDLAMRLTLNQNTINSQEKIAKERNELDLFMQEKGFVHEKELQEEQLKNDRQKMVVEMMKDNPVQAVLLSMGIGGNVPGGGAFEGLGAMEGAEQLQQETETALSGIEGATIPGGAGVTLGEQGVSGLAGIHKQASSFGKGSDAQRTLLTSAHSISGEDQVGISAQEVAQKVRQVTPKGLDQLRAGGGIGMGFGDVLPPLRYERAAEGRGMKPIVKDYTMTKIGSVGSSGGDGSGGVGNKPPVQPNTAYTVGEGVANDGTRPEVAITGDRVGPNGGPELLGIEPLTNDVGTRFDKPQTSGDPLVEMFNDPALTLNRGEPIKSETPLPVIGAETPQLETITPQMKIMISSIRRKKLNGEPLTPEEEALVKKINPRLLETTQIEQINQGQTQQVQAQQAMIEARKRATYAQRRQKYINNLPPEQRRRVQQREIQKSQEMASKNIDLAKLGPQVIEQLVQIANDPNNPKRDIAGAKLSEILPPARRNPLVTNAAVGLANIMQK